MQDIDALLSIRVGTVDGGDILSPSRIWFNWKDGILTSECKNNTCEDAHPHQDCTCGIYSVLDNGLEELANYISRPDHIVFVGWAFSTVHLYSWGLRSGQWVATGVVNWHGFRDKVISPENEREPWWDSAYSALNLLRTRKVDNPKLYSMEAVQDAIRNQMKLHEERNNAFTQLFNLKTA